MKDITKEWIGKAEKDCLVARRELEAEPPAYDVWKKYFKAILQEHDIAFERTHDLDILLEKCKDYVPELDHFKEEIVELSSFAVEVRYPGVEATVDEAQSAVSIMEKVSEIVRPYFRISCDKPT